MDVRTITSVYKVIHASICTHPGVEQFRRDELQSIGYMLLYFHIVRLPWQRLKADTKREKYDMIAYKKLAIPIATLCQGVPRDFSVYLESAPHHPRAADIHPPTTALPRSTHLLLHCPSNVFRYVRSLHFKDKPDYKYLRELFRDVYRLQGFMDDSSCDWMLLQTPVTDAGAVPPPSLQHPIPVHGSTVIASSRSSTGPGQQPPAGIELSGQPAGQDLDAVPTSQVVLDTSASAREMGVTGPAGMQVPRVQEEHKKGDGQGEGRDDDGPRQGERIDPARRMTDRTFGQRHSPFTAALLPPSHATPPAPPLLANQSVAAVDAAGVGTQQRRSWQPTPVEEAWNKRRRM
jgi:hypothetical protein